MDLIVTQIVHLVVLFDRENMFICLMLKKMAEKLKICVVGSIRFRFKFNTC